MTSEVTDRVTSYIAKTDGRTHCCPRVEWMCVIFRNRLRIGWHRKMFVIAWDVKVHHQRNVSGTEGRRWPQHKAYWQSFTKGNEE